MMMAMTRKMLLTAAVIIVGLGGRTPAQAGDAADAAEAGPARDLGQMKLFAERTAAGHTRLLWLVAKRWPTYAVGFVVRRRALGSDAWIAVTPRPILPATVPERDWALSEPDAAEAMRLQAEVPKIVGRLSARERLPAAAFLEQLKKAHINLLAGISIGSCVDYDYALFVGFACWDRQPASGAVEHGVFLAREDGSVDEVPAAVRVWDPAHPAKVELASVKAKFELFPLKGGRNTHIFKWQMTETAYNAAGIVGFEVAQITPDGTVTVAQKLTSAPPRESGIREWFHWEMERKDLAKATYRLTPVTPFGGRLAPLEFDFDRQPLDEAAAQEEARAAAAREAAAQARKQQVVAAVALPRPAQVTNFKGVYRRGDRAHCVDFTWDPPGPAPVATGAYRLWGGPVRDKNHQWSLVSTGTGEIDGKLTAYSFTTNPGSVDGDDWEMGIVAVGPNGALGESTKITVYFPRFKPPQPALRRYYENGDGTITWKWEYLEGMRELAGFRLFRDGQLAADEKKLGPAVREWTAGEFTPGQKTTFQIQAVTTNGLLTELSAAKSFTAPAKAPEAAAPKAER